MGGAPRPEALNSWRHSPPVIGRKSISLDCGTWAFYLIAQSRVRSLPGCRVRESNRSRRAANGRMRSSSRRHEEREDGDGCMSALALGGVDRGPRTAVCLEWLVPAAIWLGSSGWALGDGGDFVRTKPFAVLRLNSLVSSIFLSITHFSFFDHILLHLLPRHRLLLSDRVRSLHIVHCDRQILHITQSPPWQHPPPSTQP